MSHYIEQLKADWTFRLSGKDVLKLAVDMPMRYWISSDEL